MISIIFCYLLQGEPKDRWATCSPAQLFLPICLLFSILFLRSPGLYIIARLFAAQPYVVTAHFGSWGKKNEIR